MEACDIIFPMKCTSNASIETVGGASTAQTTSQVVGWVCVLCLYCSVCG